MPNRFAYAYDVAGNRVAEQLDDAVMGASYNGRNQLTSRQPGGIALFRGTLNEAASVSIQGKPAQVAADNTFVGQAQVASGTSSVVVAATDPSGNIRTNTYELTEAGSTTTNTYDANGNLASDGTRTFEWDAENRLTAVKQGTTTIASFVYDGSGRRAQKLAGSVTTSYVYDGDGVIEERLSTGATLRYVRGPSIDQHWAMRDGNGVVTYFLSDHLGSVVQTTDVSGSVTLSRDYDPYGNPLSGASQSGYAYTGREWDAETQLYYHRARYVDPKRGGFINEDPIGLAGGLNLYGYVGNNPTNLVDPLGLMPKRLTNRQCNPIERKACETMCGSKGMRSCEVPRTLQLVRFTDRNGVWKELWKPVDGTMSCDCNPDPEDDDENFCRKNPFTCATVIILGVITLLCTGPKLGPGMQPAPAMVPPMTPANPGGA